MRLNGVAEHVDDDPLLAEFPEAQFLWRVRATEVFPNCPRYIHRYEGAWTANTGNGYYGGLQLDLAFQRLYGADFLARFGTADTWPAWAQLQAATRAYASGRGFGPWPNTARACGLL